MKQNEQYCSTPKGERVTGHSVPEPLSTVHKVSYVTGAVLLIHFLLVSTSDVMELVGNLTPPLTQYIPQTYILAACSLYALHGHRSKRCKAV